MISLTPRFAPSSGLHECRQGRNGHSKEHQEHGRWSHSGSTRRHLKVHESNAPHSRSINKLREIVPQGVDGWDGVYHTRRSTGSIVCEIRCAISVPSYAFEVERHAVGVISRRRCDKACCWIGDNRGRTFLLTEHALRGDIEDVRASTRHSTDLIGGHVKGSHGPRRDANIFPRPLVDGPMQTSQLLVSPVHFEGVYGNTGRHPDRWLPTASSTEAGIIARVDGALRIDVRISRLDLRSIMPEDSIVG
mmetsp:Transcript_17876/g.39212  ORF Transcript_17876/g.39212 Transcript_17876/m.39212 type:complete len:248 (+) Transcript_17876:122-865(+)